jgi:hypothetical protein
MKTIDRIVKSELHKNGLQNNFKLYEHIIMTIHSRLDYCDFESSPLHFVETLCKNEVMFYKRTGKSFDPDRVVLRKNGVPLNMK